MIYNIPKRCRYNFHKYSTEEFQRTIHSLGALNEKKKLLDNIVFCWKMQQINSQIRRNNYILR